MNNFNNDGSFLENFMKISEQVQAKMKQTTSPDEEPEKVVTTLPQFAVPPPSFAGNIPNVNIFNPHVPPPPPESSATLTANTTPAPLLPELDIRNIKG